MNGLLRWAMVVPSCACVLACSASSTPEASEGETVGVVQGALSGPEFYVPPPNPGAVKQVLELMKTNVDGATRVALMSTTAHGVWFLGGNPTEVKKDVKKTMTLAKAQGRPPILVAYNLPYRDCAQYSAGGARDTAAYQAWIDGFAGGIGSDKAIVILEPDGLGLIPYNTTIFGSEEWCKPTVLDADGNPVPAPGASAEERYAQLRYAIASLRAKAPNAAVYLDATHSAWLGVSEAAYRLYRAGFEDGVQQVQGFFVNASNYQRTSEAVQFGTWVSMCLAAGTPGVGPSWMQGSEGPHFDWCAGQYDPATGYTQVNYSPEFAAGVSAAIQGLMGGASAQTHFVVDTSRNGQGPLDTARYALAPYNQPAEVVSGLDVGNWCNPRGAGLGLRPTTHTNDGLVDAFVWVKAPGESDGSCDIAGGARAWDYSAYNPWGISGDARDHFDPLWGIVDPGAGQWFSAQALELATLADPALF